MESPEVKRSTVKRKSSGLQKPLDLDEVLTKELGQFGWYQRRNILLVALPIIFSAFINEYVFSAAAIPHRLLLS